MCAYMCVCEPGRHGEKPGTMPGNAQEAPCVAIAPAVPRCPQTPWVRATSARSRRTHIVHARARMRTEGSSVPQVTTVLDPAHTQPRYILEEPATRGGTLSSILRALRCLRGEGAWEAEGRTGAVERRGEERDSRASMHGDNMGEGAAPGACQAQLRPSKASLASTGLSSFRRASYTGPPGAAHSMTRGRSLQALRKLLRSSTRQR
jgi:hypothetical protein